MNNTDRTADMIELKLINTFFKTKMVLQVVDGQKTKVPVQVVAKEFNSRKFLRRDGITSVEDYVSSTRKIAKSRCIIYDKYSNQHLAVNHSVDEVRDWLFPNKNKIGY